MIISPLKLFLLLPFALSSGSSIFDLEGIWESRYNSDDSPQVISVSEIYNQASKPAFLDPVETIDDSGEYSDLDTNAHQLSFLNLNFTPAQAIEAEIVAASELFQISADWFLGCFSSLSSNKPFDTRGCSAELKRYISIWAFVLGAFNQHSEFNLVKSSVNDDLIMPMYKYLFTHVSFKKAIITVLLDSQIDLTPQGVLEVNSFIRKKYPELHESFEILLDLMYAGLRFNHYYELKDFLMFYTDGDRFHSLFYFKRELSTAVAKVFANLPVNRSRFYAQTNIDFKFDHLRFVFERDDLEMFSKILEIEPELVFYSRKMSHNAPEIRIFTMAVEFVAGRCLDYLIRTYPNVLKYDFDLKSNIIRAILRNTDSRPGNNLFFLLEKYGITFESKIIEDEMKMNILQYSYYHRYLEVFNYYGKKAGFQRAESDINALRAIINNIY